MNLIKLAPSLTFPRSICTSLPTQLHVPLFYKTLFYVTQILGVGPFLGMWSTWQGSHTISFQELLS